MLRMVTYNAEQKQDHHNEAANAAGDRAPEDALRGCDAGVLGLLGHVSGSVETDEDTGRGEVRETPVPARRSARSVVGGQEGIVGRAEAVLALAGCNGQPDHVQDKVEEDEGGGHVEDPLEVACWKLALARRESILHHPLESTLTGQEIPDGCQSEHHLCGYPLDSPEFDA